MRPVGIDDPDERGMRQVGESEIECLGTQLELMTRFKGDCPSTGSGQAHTARPPAPSAVEGLELMTRLKGDCDMLPPDSMLPPDLVGIDDPTQRGPFGRLRASCPSTCPSPSLCRAGSRHSGQAKWKVPVPSQTREDPTQRGLRHCSRYRDICAGDIVGTDDPTQRGLGRAGGRKQETRGGRSRAIGRVLLARLSAASCSMPRCSEVTDDPIQRGLRHHEISHQEWPQHSVGTDDPNERGLPFVRLRAC